MNAVIRTHEVQDFRQASNITVFAPTNDGLRRADPTLMDRLFPRDDMGQREANPVLAPAAIGAHVVTAGMTLRSAQFTTVAATPLRVTRTADGLMVQGAANMQARVIRLDIACSNGVIQGIDTVLIR